MGLLADFLHFGTSVFLLHVGLEQWEVWGVKSAVWSVKEAVGSEKCEVWSVKCGVWSFSLECEERSVKCEVWGLECEGSSEKWEVWSVKFQFGVRRAQCEVWSVRFGVWRKQWEVRSVKCEVWSVKFEVWSAKSAVWSVECEDFASSLAEKIKRLSRDWSLECEECSVKCGVWRLCFVSRWKKSNGCRGKDTVGTGCLWTIDHLCLRNFRRRLARVYVNYILSLFSQFKLQVWGIPILKQTHVVLGVSLHWLHRTTPTSPGLKSINPLRSALNPNVSGVSRLSLHCFFMKCHKIPALVVSMIFHPHSKFFDFSRFIPVLVALSPRSIESIQETASSCGVMFSALLELEISVGKDQTLDIRWYQICSSIW